MTFWMPGEQRLACTLVLDSMISGELQLAEKTLAVVTAHARNDREWYAWPVVISILATESLLPTSQLNEAGLAEQAYAEFGALLNATEANFAAIFVDVRGADPSPPDTVARRVWQRFAICALLAREQQASSAELFNRAEAALDAEMS